MNTSPKPIIEKVCPAATSGVVKVATRSLGKINFIGLSIYVATVTMTSEANTKTQS